MLVPTDEPAADPPGKPAEQKAAEDIQCIVYVLDQQQEGDTDGNQQCGPPIAPAGEAEVQQEHGGSMAREEEVFGDEPVVAVKEITQWIRQADQSGRRVEGNEGNGHRAEDAQKKKGPDEDQKNAGILNGPKGSQSGHAPDQDEEGNGYIVCGNSGQQRVIEDGALSLLNLMKKIRKN